MIIHKNRKKFYVDISHNFMIKKINIKAKIQKIYTMKHVAFKSVSQKNHVSEQYLMILGSIHYIILDIIYMI